MDINEFVSFSGIRTVVLVVFILFLLAFLYVRFAKSSPRLGCGIQIAGFFLIVLVFCICFKDELKGKELLADKIKEDTGYTISSEDAEKIIKTNGEPEYSNMGLIHAIDPIGKDVMLVYTVKNQCLNLELLDSSATTSIIDVN